MLITSLNKAVFPNVLVAIVAPNADHQDSEQKDDIVRVFATDDQRTLGYNFLAIDRILPELDQNGQVILSEAQVAKLNAALETAGFQGELVAQTQSKFVVGFVKEVKKHPDSDHLHITQVEVADGQTLQIVCGAANVAEGQKVVVCEIGAMMPSGQIIWPGKLRGVTSDGMLAAARELALPNAPQKHGILILPASAQTGAPFDFEKGAALVAQQNV
ncbi:tRNA-binding domain-containing protein [Lactobacillus selangorensis]|uniref:tRNA-binding domain-containing protein n=1 Tax=Lactobacillus selangorensis TaxID=81857 RepID=A0A0R2G1K9_9LACO|nr:DUF4479 and tRNA-binding domain-containing protein [Lactobacillus selangorensis]KRN29748.1 tRNA-binding domain-containing protein [Lactobacillus selangorensis]KRN33723.1 tRNA-binding domain-containing protein [Lactobacillus selangorensis]